MLNDWTRIKHFIPAEFECRCGCGLLNVHWQLVTALDMARDRVGVPMVITSASRCPEHNARVGGMPDSAHLAGLAVDIACTDSWYRFRLTDILLALFPRIGIAKDFIHADMDPSKPQDVLWRY